MVKVVKKKVKLLMWLLVLGMCLLGNTAMASIYRIEYSADFPGMGFDGYIDTTTDALYIQNWFNVPEYPDFMYSLTPVVSLPWVWRAYTPSADNTAMIPYDIPDNWNGIINWQQADGTVVDPTAPLWAFVAPQAASRAIVYPSRDLYPVEFPPVLTWFDPVTNQTVEVEEYVWETVPVLGGNLTYNHNINRLDFNAGVSDGYLSGIVGYSAYRQSYSIYGISGTVNIYKQDPTPALASEPSTAVLCLVCLLLFIIRSRYQNT